MQISSNGTRVLYALGLGPAIEKARRRRRRQGNPALEHRPDLEAVRSRRGVGRALRLSLHDVPSRRSARGAARRASGASGRTRSISTANASASRRTTMASTIQFESGEAATAPHRDRRRRRAVARARLRCSAPTGRSSPASSPGAVLVPRERVPAGIKMDVGTNWVGPGGHVVHYPVRGGQLLNFVGLLERDDWRVESWTVQGSKDEFCQRLPQLASRHPRHDPQRRHALQVGAVRAPADAGLDRAAASRCWATPAIPCCRCWRRAR